MIQLLAQESIGQRVVRFFEVRADAVDSAVDAGLGFAVKLGSQPSVATRERSAAVSRTTCAFASNLWQTWMSAIRRSRFSGVQLPSSS